MNAFKVLIVWDVSIKYKIVFITIYIYYLMKKEIK